MRSNHAETVRGNVLFRNDIFLLSSQNSIFIKNGMFGSATRSCNGHDASLKRELSEKVKTLMVKSNYVSIFTRGLLSNEYKIAFLRVGVQNEIFANGKRICDFLQRR